MNPIGTFIPLEMQTVRAGIPQRVVLRPGIHIEEVRTVPGRLIRGHGDPTCTIHVKHYGPHRYLHASEHLCPHIRAPGGLISRHNPKQQETSVALQNVERDWDFLERHRELIFDNRRIKMCDAPWDKVWALAEDIWTFRRIIQKPGGNDFSKSCPWSHPVDSIIYGSWCLGGAYALIGLCATLGYAAREISIGGHSQAEVHFEGRWNFVESIARFPPSGGVNMVRDNFARIRLDPFNKRYGFCEQQRAAYWETTTLTSMSPANPSFAIRW